MALRGCWSASSQCDLIILDCPPGLSLLSVNAIVAADGLIMRSRRSRWPSGVGHLLAAIERVRSG
jgi:cellulose biosynthesis protein BcsQ